MITTRCGTTLSWRCSRNRTTCRPGAGKSTLNRLELSGATIATTERYKKIAVDHDAVDRLSVDVFIKAHEGTPPSEVILDLDATDDPVHGGQEGRFFHGYYGHYCFLPLYIFAGEHLLCARLRGANIDASAGALEEVERIVAQLRAAWPTVRITLRADSGFCRDELMTWCEEHVVDYVFGLARNARLLALIPDELAQAAAVCAATEAPARVFAERMYQHVSDARQLDVHAARGGYMSSCTARAATWRTGSKSSN